MFWQAVVGWRAANGAQWGVTRGLAMTFPTKAVWAVAACLAGGGLLTAGCDRNAGEAKTSVNAFAAPGGSPSASAGVTMVAQPAGAAPSIETPVLAWRSGNGVEYEGDPLVGTDGSAYVLSPGNGVYAYAPDGRVRWTYSADMGLPRAMALGKDDSLFVVDDFGRVHKVAPNGQVQWVADPEGPTSRRPDDWPEACYDQRTTARQVVAVPDGGAVVVGNGGRAVRRFGVAGGLDWEVMLTEPVHHLAVAPLGDVYAMNGPVWLSGDEHPPDHRTLARISRAGEVLWECEVHQFSELMLSPGGLPIILTRDDGACELDDTGAVQRKLEAGWLMPIAFPSPTRWVYMWDDGIREWSGSEWRTLYGPPEPRDDRETAQVAIGPRSFAPDGAVYLSRWVALEERAGGTERPAPRSLTKLASNGTTVWEFELEALRWMPTSAPVPAPDGAVYAMLDGMLCRFDDASRVTQPVDPGAWHNPTTADLGLEEAWRLQTASEPTRREHLHVAESGRVYALLEQPEAPPQEAVALVAIEPDGQVRWREYWGTFALTHPAIAEAKDGSVWFRADQRLYWIPPNGGDRWRVTIPSFARENLDTDFSDYSPPIPLPDGGAVALTESDGILATSERGELLWRHTLGPPPPSLAFDGSVIYVAGVEERDQPPCLLGLGLDGSELWRLSLEQGPGGLAAVRGGGAVVATGDGTVRGLRPDGTESWAATCRVSSGALFAAQVGSAPEVEPDRRSVLIHHDSSEVVLDREGCALERWSSCPPVRLVPRTPNLGTNAACTRRYPNGVIAWHYLTPQNWPGQVVEGPNGWLYVREGTTLAAYRPVASPALAEQEERG